jgi:hypothetical protein
MPRARGVSFGTFSFDGSAGRFAIEVTDDFHTGSLGTYAIDICRAISKVPRCFPSVLPYSNLLLITYSCTEYQSRFISAEGRGHSRSLRNLALFRGLTVAKELK